MYLELINSIFTHQLRQNPAFIYAVIYQKELFLQNSEETTDQTQHVKESHLARNPVTVGNIQKVVNYFLGNIEIQLNTKTLTFDLVLSVIQDSSLKWNSDQLNKTVDLHFQYEEEKDAHRFFGPFLWSCVYHHHFFHDHWTPHQAKLFGDYEEVPENATREHVGIETEAPKQKQEVDMDGEAVVDFEEIEIGK